MAFDDVATALDYVTTSEHGQQVSIFGSDPAQIGALVDPLVNQVCRVNINCQCQRGPDVFPFAGRKDSLKARSRWPMRCARSRSDRWWRPSRRSPARHCSRHRRRPQVEVHPHRIHPVSTTTRKPMRRQRQSKIVATLGPASSDLSTIRALFDAGADVFRLNFSHGTQVQHQERLELIRRVESDTGRPIGVLLDLQGPKLRIGTFADGPIRLDAGPHFASTSMPRRVTRRGCRCPTRRSLRHSGPAPTCCRRRQGPAASRELRS